MSAVPATITGRVWLFGDDVNTDVMMPGSVLFSSAEEQTRACFASMRPGWVDEVRPGEIVVAGRNFGCGSSRPASRSLVRLGVALVVAESLASLFLRNCVSYGLPAFECPGISALVPEGAMLTADPAAARCWTEAAELAGRKLPSDLLETMFSGGTLPELEEKGLVRLRR